MKAVILGAGRDTRARQALPKPMLPIFNRPVMEILVDLLVRHGFRQIIVSTSYMTPVIESYFRDGSRFGAEIGYSFGGHFDDGHMTGKPLGSAGALRRIQEHSGFFDQTFIVVCGDALIDLDLTALYRLHREKGALATIALANVRRQAVSSHDVVVTEENEAIVEFQEKPSAAEAKSTTVSTGIYVFEPDILRYVPDSVPYDLGGQLVPQLVALGLPCFGILLPAQWPDIGTVAGYYGVIQSALLGRVDGLKIPGTEIAKGIWVGLNVRVDPSRCHLIPPLCIGSSATIEPGCTLLGPCLIGRGCLVESGAHVERSLVFDYTRVGSLAKVRSKVISGRFCVDSTGQTIDLGNGHVDWVVPDVRTPRKVLTEDQQPFFDALMKA